MTEQKEHRETEYRRHTGTTSTPSRRRNKKDYANYLLSF